MITLDALLALAGVDMSRAVDLGKRLRALDDERRTIIAELAEMGIKAASDEIALVVSQPTSPRRRPMANPPCHCGDPGEVTVDGVWYCCEHDPKP